MPTNAGDDDRFLVALAALPKVGPARLRLFLDLWSPEEAWDRIRRGRALASAHVRATLGMRAAELGALWVDAASHLDPQELLQTHNDLGVSVLRKGRPGYPDAFRDDPDPPELVFARGNLACLTQRSVAIVGTRRCTRYGHDVARRFGHELADAGVAVVSGLALGIDGAAHEGALDATMPGAAAPIAVVGSGLDVIYPSRNRVLWERVGRLGLLLSEAPLGSRPERWRFPARNRLIAALAEAVIVVESSSRGGSMHTVDEASIRSRDVFAVPGAITSATSKGTNQLIADGACPALEVSDILHSMGLDSCSPGVGTSSDPTTGLGSDDRVVLDTLTTGPRTLGEIAASVNLTFDRLALVVTNLEAAGHVARQGAYFETCH